MKDYVKYLEENWTPQEGDDIWTIDASENSVYQISYYDGMSLIESFKTEKAAKEALKKILDVLRKCKKQ